MEKDSKTTDFKEQEKELLRTLDEISTKLIKGDAGSFEALRQLEQILSKLEMIELAEKINSRLVSILWILKDFVQKLYQNLGEDTRGFPKTEGTKILQDITRHLGIFIQTSLFRNRSKDSIGTFEYVIKSYYDLLHLTEESSKKEISDEYVTL